MADALLSILIPSLPERIDLLEDLLFLLQRQIRGKPIELMVLMDNRYRSAGAKRNMMMDVCLGKFLTFLDDDDSVSEDYADSLLTALQSQPDVDVVCISSQADLGDKMPFIVRTSLNFENEDSNISTVPVGISVRKFRPDIRRKPWHWCVWKTNIARQGRFPDNIHTDDWIWLQQVIPLCKKQFILDKVLHFYFYRPNISLSQQ
jgi:hypothetical protein